MTRWLSRRLAAAVSGDEGATLITVMMFMMVASVLAATVALVSIHGDQNANRDRQAAGALQTAEGGVSQAMQVIRTSPPGYFTCVETNTGGQTSLSASCTSNPTGWTSSTHPELVSGNGTVGSCVSGQACYQVWISTIQAYNPPSASTAVYRVHSTGLSGGGPAARSLVVDVSATPDHFPIGLYADAVATNGTPNVYHESLFSLNCIQNRVPDSSNGSGGLKFDGSIDYEHDMPAAAHSADKITTENNGCADSVNGNGNSGPIHKTSTGTQACNASFPYDQDSEGGTLTPGDGCYQTWTSPNTGSKYPTTSKFTVQNLYDFGYRPGGLSPSQYAALKTLAQAQGTYFTSSTSSPYTALNANQSTNAVVYYDLGNTGGTVNIGPSDIPPMYVRAVQSASCTLASVVIVVRNGNLKFNSTGNGFGSGMSLIASVFVPEGSYDSQGSLSVIGTLYAKTLSLEGGQSWQLDPCFVANPPGLLMNVHVLNFRQVDTQNID